MGDMLYISAADIAHITRICNDVDYWAKFCDKKGHLGESERLMPPALLIGYATNLLIYWKKPFIHRNRAKSFSAIERALKQISKIVFVDDYAEMEVRMIIMRLYHESGYGVQYPATYRL